MTRIVFVAHDGERFEVEAEDGLSVMEVAVRNSVPGIVAECGGACSCATCHVYVDERWLDRVGGADAMERDMLDFAKEPHGNSRLSCQVRVSGALDGLVVTLPQTQG